MTAVRDFGRVMLVNDVQPLNMLEPPNVYTFGIVKFVSEEQPLNIYAGMVVALVELNLIKPVAPANKPFSNDVTLVPISTNLGYFIH